MAGGDGAWAEAVAQNSFGSPAPGDDVGSPLGRARRRQATADRLSILTCLRSNSHTTQQSPHQTAHSLIPTTLHKMSRNQSSSGVGFAPLLRPAEPLPHVLVADPAPTNLTQQAEMFEYIVAFFLPPLGVFLKRGFYADVSHVPRRASRRPQILLGYL